MKLVSENSEADPARKRDRVEDAIREAECRSPLKVAATLNRTADLVEKTHPED
jgi:hypothetical protein